jgi:hypothetical protein
MGGNKKELEQNPRWAALYKKAAGKYLETVVKKREGIRKDIESYFQWWINFCSGRRTQIEKEL